MKLLSASEDGPRKKEKEKEKKKKRKIRKRLFHAKLSTGTNKIKKNTSKTNGILNIHF